MAIIYVDSAAAGLANGTSWTDAYVTMLAAFGDAGISADDFIYVDDGHSEAPGALTEYTSHAYAPYDTVGEPLKIICVDKADDSPSTGALINVTGALWLTGRQYWYGVKLQSSAEITGGTNGTVVVLESCILAPTTFLYMTRSSAAGMWDLINTDLTPGAVGCYIRRANYGRLHWNGGTLTSNVTNLIQAGISPVLIENVDLSALTGNLTSYAGNGAVPVVRNCTLNATTTLAGDTLTAISGLVVEHCQAGTDSDPAYQLYHADKGGNTQIDTASYRSGSAATDGVRTNPYSYSLISVAGVKERYAWHKSAPFGHRWCGGNGSQAYTATIYVASGATLDNDELWVEIMRVNDLSTSSLGVVSTSKIAVLATPANLTTDGTSTWTGADVTIKQKIDITFTPDKPGMIYARAYLAKPSERVSIDPVIYLSPAITTGARTVAGMGVGTVYEGDAGSTIYVGTQNTQVFPVGGGIPSGSRF